MSSFIRVLPAGAPVAVGDAMTRTDREQRMSQIDPKKVADNGYEHFTVHSKL